MVVKDSRFVWSRWRGMNLYKRDRSSLSQNKEQQRRQRNAEEDDDRYNKGGREGENKLRIGREGGMKRALPLKRTLGCAVLP